MKSTFAIAVLALINNTSAKHLSLLDHNAPIGYIMMQEDPVAAPAATPPPELAGGAPAPAAPGAPAAPTPPVDGAPAAPVIADPSAAPLAEEAKAAAIPANIGAPS
jgi:hypothetical protein